jgi:hypothetical protein
MIRDKIISSLIRAVRYDGSTLTMVVEFVDGSQKKHVSVPYEIYQAIVNSRFPAKTYHQFLRSHVFV